MLYRITHHCLEQQEHWVPSQGPGERSGDLEWSGDSTHIARDQSNVTKGQLFSSCVCGLQWSVGSTVQVGALSGQLALGAVCPHPQQHSTSTKAQDPQWPIASPGLAQARAEQMQRGPSRSSVVTVWKPLALLRFFCLSSQLPRTQAKADIQVFMGSYFLFSDLCSWGEFYGKHSPSSQEIRQPGSACRSLSLHPHRSSLLTRRLGPPCRGPEPPAHAQLPTCPAGLILSLQHQPAQPKPPFHPCG